MSEIEYAECVANVVLDRPYADPDADLSVLARQFLRSREELHSLRQRVEALEKALRRADGELDAAADQLRSDKHHGHAEDIDITREALRSVLEGEKT